MTESLDLLNNLTVKHGFLVKEMMNTVQTVDVEL